MSSEVEGAIQGNCKAFEPDQTLKPKVRLCRMRLSIMAPRSTVAFRCSQGSAVSGAWTVCVPDVSSKYLLANSHSASAVLLNPTNRASRSADAALRFFLERRFMGFPLQSVMHRHHYPLVRLRFP